MTYWKISPLIEMNFRLIAVPKRKYELALGFITYNRIAKDTQKIQSSRKM